MPFITLDSPGYSSLISPATGHFSRRCLEDSYERSCAATPSLAARPMPLKLAYVRDCRGHLRRVVDLEPA